MLRSRYVEGHSSCIRRLFGERARGSLIASEYPQTMPAKFERRQDD